MTGPTATRKQEQRTRQQLSNFRRGQLAGKMSDEAFKQFMERVSQQTQRTTIVKVKN